jgi:hypothetical protein
MNRRPCMLNWLRKLFNREYKYWFVYSYKSKSGSESIGRAIITCGMPINTEKDLIDIEDRITEHYGHMDTVITNVIRLKG